MLIRFIVKNLFSFKEETEFNLLPGRPTRLGHHKYERNGLQILKQTAIYGANGSGKSNLVKAIGLLQAMIRTGVIPYELSIQKFKLAKLNEERSIEFGIEVFCDSKIYFFSIEINNGVVLEEYFTETEANKERLIFHRTHQRQKISIQFFEGFDEKNENVLLKTLIENDLLLSDQLLFTFLNKINNNAFDDIKNVYLWFDKGLEIIGPETVAATISHALDSNIEIKNFTNGLMRSFNTGISDVLVEVKPIGDLIGKLNQKDVDDIAKMVLIEPHQARSWTNRKTGEEFVFVYRGGEIFFKKMIFQHIGEENDVVNFEYADESDGTKRLLDFSPLFFILLNHDNTIIIDEIERSLHPAIIKELVSKFSLDENTKGQLIFTTHESNLLDRDIFRTDEVWFAEKGLDGVTKLYSLSDFKEHNTIDIRKGYLSGRYGAVPFLGNLHDLNWHKIDENA